jgi:hypothetical protein
MNKHDVAELGRGRVTTDLQRAGFTVVRAPQGDGPQHLIAQATLNTSPPRKISRPIRVKAATESSFTVWRAWAQPLDLLLVYTWYVTEPAEAVTYALTYPEAEEITRRLGWQSSRSWQQLGGYGTTSAAQHRPLCDLLAPYRMTPERWWEKVTRCA